MRLNNLSTSIHILELVVTINQSTLSNLLIQRNHYTCSGTPRRLYRCSFVQAICLLFGNLRKFYDIVENICNYYFVLYFKFCDISLVSSKLSRREIWYCWVVIIVVTRRPVSSMLEFHGDAYMKYVWNNYIKF
jgi:hypothetical protein